MNLISKIFGKNNKKLDMMEIDKVKNFFEINADIINNPLYQFLLNNDFDSIEYSDKKLGNTHHSYKIIVNSKEIYITFTFLKHTHDTLDMDEYINLYRFEGERPISFAELTLEYIPHEHVKNENDDIIAIYNTPLFVKVCKLITDLAFKKIQKDKNNNKKFIEELLNSK